MHVFVDAETVKRVAVTKRGVSEWDVVSQVRIGRCAQAWVPASARNRSASPTPSPAVADAGAGCCCRTGSHRWHLGQ